MSYRFKITETVPDGVRRIAKEEIRSAVSHLTQEDPEKVEEAIHEARKAIKRLRALLRLVRPELGSWFRKDNAALRDVGRSLSDLRDSSIVLETFDALSDVEPERQSLQSVRTGLQERRQVKEAKIDTGQTLQKAADGLHAVAQHIDEWPLQSDGFEAIAEGLEGEYQGGRKAMLQALRKDDSLIFHEWRKRAKCQLFHMRLLKNVLSNESRQQEEKLHQLESALGDDHNLLILRQHLDAHPKAFGGKKKVRQSMQLVNAREQKLRKEAEALGDQIYTQKPKELVARLREEWKQAHEASVSQEKRRPVRVPAKTKTPPAA